MFREQNWGHTSPGWPVFVLQEERERGGGGGGRDKVRGAEREVGGKTTSYGLIKRTVLLLLPLPLHTGPGEDNAGSLG